MKLKFKFRKIYNFRGAIGPCVAITNRADGDLFIDNITNKEQLLKINNETYIVYRLKNL